MFTHMTGIQKETFTAHGKEYEFLLFRIDENGTLRLFVSTGGFGVGPTFSVKRDVVENMMHENGQDAGQALIDQAKHEILRNEFSEY